MRRMTLRALALLALAGLTACAAPPPAPRPFTAALANGETFAGALDPAGAGGGRTFTMTSAQGLTCNGAVQRAATGGARAAFACTDGRTGSFPVVLGGGAGAGTLGGQALTVSLG